MKEENMKEEKIYEEVAPKVKSKVGRILIWTGVVLLAGSAVGTRNLILVILATLAPFIAGFFTSKGRVRRK